MDIDLIQKLQAAKPVLNEHTILTFIRITTDEYVEVSPDFGATWKEFPIAEIQDAEAIRKVLVANNTYWLVRLVLKPDHPTIETIALRAQIDWMRTQGQCECGAAERDSSPEINPMMQPLQCGSRCARETGCGWWRCLYNCVFQ